MAEMRTKTVRSVQRPTDDWQTQWYKFGWQIWYETTKMKLENSNVPFAAMCRAIVYGTNWNHTVHTDFVKPSLYTW